ncbi:MAG: CotH kinase family protein [Pirellulales bacterium]|nr:CotH kinase family protein [Pirellulales bacterium]
MEPRTLLAATDLRITEFLASNDDGVTDVDGDSSDWLEIYNSGPTAVDLAGLYLTDNANNKTKWAFPAGAGSIPAGGYRVVFASDKNGIRGGGELHTNFKLSADGEYLGLIAADGSTVIDAYAPRFPKQFEDVSYGRAMEQAPGGTTVIANGAQARAWVPTSSVYDATWRNLGFNDSVFPLVGATGFGYENNPGDAVNFTAEIGTTVPNTTRSLYMRIPFTLATLAGVDRLTLRMRYDDGFVAYVNGVRVAEANAPATLQWNSAALNGSRPDSQAEQFVDFDVTFAIPHLVAGQNVLAIHGLNAPGSDMLISPELVVRSAVLPATERLGYFDATTPGYGNPAANFVGFAESPTFGVPHGFYGSTQTVALATTTPGAIIVYTTDGSSPAVNANQIPTNGTLYVGPIAVSSTTTLRATAFKPDFKPSFVAASSYLFLDDIVNQSPTGTPPAGWPASGAVNGQEMNYGIDPDIIALYGAQAVKDSLASLPAISITTDLANLFDPQTGIYVNAWNDGRDWERPASVELIYPDGAEGFSTNAGLRIRGGWSRNDWYPKHAFRLYFRGEYGDGKLDYPLFGDEGPDKFDVVDLRTDQNYSWAAYGSVETTFLREVFSRDLQRDMGQPYTRSRYYHLYVGGQYFGLYMTQERVQEDYAATYFGGEPEDYDVLKAGRNDGGGTQLAEGNDAAWQQLFTLAQAIADSPAANAGNYLTLQGLNSAGVRDPALPVLLDVENLVDFMMIIIYTGGFDTGISRFFGENEANNWYGVYNRVAADQGFQYFIHDNEHSLGPEEGGTVHGTQFIDRTGPFNAGNQSNYAYFNPVYLHQDLLSVAAYRQRFADRAQELLSGAGLMTPAASIARMEERRVQVEPAVIAESARWGDSKVAVPLNKSHWQTEVDWLYNTYFPGRTNTVISQLRADGLYATAPQFSVPAGETPIGTMLAMSAPGNLAGVLYYTLDGVSDPMSPSGGVNNNGQTRIYGIPIAISQDTTVKARYRLSNGVWSPLAEISYVTYQPGDYNGDTIVDGGDFLAWQRQFGGSASPAGSGADGDRSGGVDASDLALWRSKYGSAAPAVAVAAAIADPFELPASVILAAPQDLGSDGDDDAQAAVDLVLAETDAWTRRWAADSWSPAPRSEFVRPLRRPTPTAGADAAEQDDFMTSWPTLSSAV